MVHSVHTQHMKGGAYLAHIKLASTLNYLADLYVYIFHMLTEVLCLELSKGRKCGAGARTRDLPTSVPKVFRLNYPRDTVTFFRVSVLPRPPERFTFICFMLLGTVPESHWPPNVTG